MKQKTFEKYFLGAILVVAVLALYMLAQAQTETPGKPVAPPTDKEKIITGKIITVFGADGLPINQSQAAKGFHRVAGTIKLVGGRGLVTLNTRTVEGRQDVSFISKDTYKGSVTVTDTTNTKTYKVYPRTNKMAVIVSSDTTDTATVGYTLEGE